MSIRQRFDRQLAELREDVLKMGGMVEEELDLALAAFETMDTAKARQVYALDDTVNAIRFEIEERCFELIVTQQPTARDLRAIVSVMNMIVDLERMGDQTKGIAKVIPHLAQSPDRLRPAELTRMGMLVGRMLNQTMTAYAYDNVELARKAASQDDEVDVLYGQVFAQVMQEMAKTFSLGGVEVAYEILRVARELERFGDLATNVAERVIYLVTGRLQETNIDQGSTIA